MEQTVHFKNDLEKKKMEKKKFKSVAEAYAEYSDICGDCRALLYGQPNPEYPAFKGKTLAEIKEITEELDVKEATRLFKRFSAWRDAVEDSIFESDDWNELMSMCGEDQDLYKVLNMAEED